MKLNSHTKNIKICVNLMYSKAVESSTCLKHLVIIWYLSFIILIVCNLVFSTDTANSVCSCLEAVFLHGLKSKAITKVS